MVTPNLTGLGLHTGANNTLCSCKPCAHRILTISRRLGITPDVLIARLGVTPTPKKTPSRKAPARRGGQVSERVTVTASGTQFQGTDAILATVNALNRDR